jgi:aspartyl/glutamyl-tRNA(Asn/Gln) amidotransferase C subunit
MITTQDVENLAKLARLKIDDNEKSQLVKEIDSILAYVDQIKQATIESGTSNGTGKLDAETRIGKVRNVMRPDEVRNGKRNGNRSISAEDRECILAEIPDREGDFVAVKKIL